MKNAARLVFAITSLVSYILSFEALDQNQKGKKYQKPNGANSVYLNNTFYLGRSYEYEYDKWYWTIAIVRFYNSTLDGKSDLFV